MNIQPGVHVLFTGPYSLTVGTNTRLNAEGNASDPIVFSALNKDIGWTGLRFLDSGDDDVLTHCTITSSKKQRAPITETEDVNEMDDIVVFHAGTKSQDGNIATNGGRVLGVTAVGNSFKETRKKAYNAMENINFDGMQYRKDIAAKAEED